MGTTLHRAPAVVSPPDSSRRTLSAGFIVHSFNRVANVDQLAAGLRRVRQSELIVCDDGSVDRSRERWLPHLSGPNDFMILSNDLHEIRILDRAIHFARDAIVCLIQDDDTIPDDTAWLDNALQQFERHPNLAMLGGFMGFNSCSRDPIETRDSSIWADAPFQFVWHVNIGPYFIRKKHYEALGGWDYSFSDAGEPGIGFDSELCLRAWLNGYQVGYKFAPIKGSAKQYSLEGGTMLFSKGPRFRNQWRNHKILHNRYSEHASRISALVARANQSIRGS